MTRSNLLFLCLWLYSLSAFGQSPSSFVQVEDSNFVLDGEPYKYIGTNLWYGMHLGSTGPGGDRQRLMAELDQLKALGLTNLRIMAASEGQDGPYQNSPGLQTSAGVYNEDLLNGLDFLLSEMQKRDMKAVVCLGNFWMWSGGFTQYVSWTDQTEIPYPDIENGGTWNPFIDYAQSFYTNTEAMQLYWDHVSFIINRTNRITQRKYKDDPAIMAWQLSNEPRGYSQVKAYQKWVKKSARYIKSMDRNHLVCIGSEGNSPGPVAGIDLLKDNKSRHIDYCTTHIWIQNWSWYEPTNAKSFDQAVKKTYNYLADQKKRAQKLGKPLVIEEFGVSRDGANFESSATINQRNKYFRIIFDKVLEGINSNEVIQGCNFWSWGGTAKPNNPGQLWKAGDPLIGDPAHERQGWYSVYSTDESTLELILQYTARLQKEIARKSSVVQ